MTVDRSGAPQARARTRGALEVRGLEASYAGLRVVHGIDFDIAPSEFVTLLGPSGCGKTTTLRCVAGLHPVEGGTITVDGEVVSSAKLHVRPERRRINMVFQSYAIWPHMSVFDNVAYGIKKSASNRPVRRKRVEELLDLVGLSEFADRHATGLSGGQQQRVALARALATEPRVLLLDEPLSNLDAVLRARMRTEIMRIQREAGTTTLYVTHDRREALSMSHRVVVLRDGRIEQAGTPVELYTRPISRFVAEFLGFANILRAKVISQDAASIRAVACDLDSKPEISLPRESDRTVPAVGAEIMLVVRPPALRVNAPGDENIFKGRLESREFFGDRTELSMRCGPLLLKAEVLGAPSASDGEEVALSLDPRQVTWVPAEPSPAELAEVQAS